MLIVYFPLRPPSLSNDLPMPRARPAMNITRGARSIGIAVSVVSAVENPVLKNDATSVHTAESVSGIIVPPVR